MDRPFHSSLTSEFVDLLAAIGEKQSVPSHENSLAPDFLDTLNYSRFKRATIDTDSGRFAATAGSVENLAFFVLEGRTLNIKWYSQRDGKINRAPKIGVHAFNRFCMLFLSTTRVT